MREKTVKKTRKNVLAYLLILIAISCAIMIIGIRAYSNEDLVIRGSDVVPVIFTAIFGTPLAILITWSTTAFWQAMKEFENFVNVLRVFFPY